MKKKFRAFLASEEGRVGVKARCSKWEFVVSTSYAPYRC